MLRDILATLEGMAAPGDEEEPEIVAGPPWTPEQTEQMRAWARGVDRQNAAELLAGDSPSPQQPTQEAVRLMHKARTTNGTARFVYDDKEIAIEIDRFAARRVAALEDQLAQQSIDLGNAISRAREAEEVETAAADKARREALEECALLCERFAYDNPPAESASDVGYRLRDSIRALTTQNDAAPYQEGEE